MGYESYINPIVDEVSKVVSFFVLKEVLCLILRLFSFSAFLYGYEGF